MLSDRLIALLPPAVHQLRLVHGLRIIARSFFWLLLIAIVLLSVAPPRGRPVTGVPHVYEHVGIFLLFGVSFATGYLVRLISVAGLAAFTGCVELVQFIVPGRHPRWSDFIGNIAGIGLGIALIWLLNWLMDRLPVPPRGPKERSTASR
jgi:hypothetical protein